MIINGTRSISIAVISKIDKIESDVLKFHLLNTLASLNRGNNAIHMDRGAVDRKLICFFIDERPVDFKLDDIKKALLIISKAVDDLFESSAITKS